MEYQEYIDLGFKRTDLDDNTEFKETGYYGFCLVKKYNKKISIYVYSGELDDPKLFIKKRDGDSYYITKISTCCVIDLFTKE